MKSNRLTLIVMGIVLLAFVVIKVAPLLKTHTFPEAGKVTIMPKAPPFTMEGKAWFCNAVGDTLTEINIEIAETSNEISKGMMFRESMEDNEGMLFIFPDMDFRSFWMKNTFIPLDIIYIKENGYIDSYYSRTTPKSKNSLPSTGEAMFVLEVNAGYLNKHGIDISSRLIFEKQ